MRLLTGQLFLFAAIVAGNIAVADQPKAAEDFFHAQIEPILVGHCLECHGEARKGELDLRSRPTSIEGGESGAVIEPGDPEASLLYEYIVSGEMPPKHPLADGQIAAIEKWIRDGVFFPTEPIDPFAISTDTRAGYDWWSLQPLQPPADPVAAVLPANRDASWDAHPIDRLIGAGLREAGLSPSPPADPTTLIRRATFDLTGLPPTPQAVAEFNAACETETGQPGTVGQASYAGLVDRLLQSQHYGEHWGRHWLDVVRFGESNGFERNVIHENVWPFRDYVIRSFNDDKPFDQLAVEHLAGDAIDADDPDVAVGTAFLVCGPYDNVGNQDKDAAAQIRANTIDEMIRATSEAFLGMTVGCSRCHDHKFDPIAQRDYYALYATLAGVQHGERVLHRKVPAKADPDPAPESPQRRPAVTAKLNTESFPAIDARRVRFTVSATNASEPCIDELEIFTVATDAAPARNVATASAGGRATSSGDYAGNPSHKLVHINDGQYGNSHSWISNTNGSGWVQIELADRYRIDRIVWGRHRQEQFADRVATEYKIEVADDDGKWKTVASSQDRQALEGSDPGDPNALKWWVGRFQQTNGPFHIFIGGSPQRPGDQVTAGSPTILDQTAGSYELAADSAEQDRRRKLAEWIVADDNPITPRVLANRLWHYHFGTGIVNTPSDFGFLGGRPTHPELLDWLAIELKKSDWRLKPLHRQIMLSQTYRQSSVYRDDAAKVDRDARLLWRFPPRRLSAEEIRDSTLLVAGKLDTTMGGLGFRLFRYVQDNVATYYPLDQHGPETYRRAVYHHNARAMQIDLMSEFDSPDCAFSTPRRSSTTTPLQALTLMNHSFTVAMADAFAQRIETESASIEQQVMRAFRLAYSRFPSDQEAEAGRALISEHGASAFCRALLNTNEFINVQ